MHNKVREPLFHIVKRDTLPWYQAWGIRAIAIVLALLLCALITTLCTHLNPIKVFGTMFSGAFGSPRKIWILGQNLAILLCISLAVTPAFKMRFWNIGAEGQVLAGGLAAAVSQRPDNDGRMVLGTFVHTLRTIHVCRQPSAILRQRCRAIAHTVRFDIRLIYHIQSVTVAKSVPIRVGRIMRIAHRIDIVLFHQADILLHQFLTDSTSQLGMFVPVNTFHQYRYPIDTETAVLYFRSAEPHPATGYFGHLARSILQLQKQCIKIRMFRTPCLHCRESLPRKRDSA